MNRPECIARAGGFTSSPRVPSRAWRRMTCRSWTHANWRGCRRTRMSGSRGRRGSRSQNAPRRVVMWRRRRESCGRSSTTTRRCRTSCARCGRSTRSAARMRGGCGSCCATRMSTCGCGRFACLPIRGRWIPCWGLRRNYDPRCTMCRSICRSSSSWRKLIVQPWCDWRWPRRCSACPWVIASSSPRRSSRTRRMRTIIICR